MRGGEKRRGIERGGRERLEKNVEREGVKGGVRKKRR